MIYIVKKSGVGMKNDDGFTLSEVLITLGIIGVIAAITIPTLLKNIQNMQYKIAWKKTFSAYSQAFIKMANENGGEVSSDVGWLRQNLPTYLFAQDPIMAGSCNSDYSHMRLGGSCYSGTLVTNDGVRILITGYGPYGQDLSFDVNGDKGPNFFGQDVFAASYTKEGRLIPYGADGATINSSYICRPNSSTYNWIVSGWSAFQNGTACSAKYLQE